MSNLTYSLSLLAADGIIRIIIGYMIAYAAFLPWIHRHTKIRRRDPDALQPEARLYLLLWSAYELLSSLKRILTVTSGPVRDYRTVWFCLD